MRKIESDWTAGLAIGVMSLLAWVFFKYFVLSCLALGAAASVVFGFVVWHGLHSRS
jgi:hypothetical protein